MGLVLKIRNSYLLFHENMWWAAHGFFKKNEIPMFCLILCIIICLNFIFSLIKSIRIIDIYVWDFVSYTALNSTNKWPVHDIHRGTTSRIYQNAIFCFALILKLKVLLKPITTQQKIREFKKLCHSYIVVSTYSRVHKST